MLPKAITCSRESDPRGGAAEEINALTTQRFGPAGTRHDAQKMALAALAQRLPEQLGTDPAQWVHMRTRTLLQVKVPTLFAVGDVEEVGPAIAKRHAALTPGATDVLIPNSAHMSTWDNHDVLVRAIRKHRQGAEPGEKRYLVFSSKHRNAG